MHRLAIACFAVLLCTTAPAAEVFMTRDAQGRPVYTDRPESLPAAKVRASSR